MESETLEPDPSPHPTSPTTGPEPEEPEPSEKPKSSSGSKRRIIFITLGLLAGCAMLVLGIPWIRHSLHTVSTDDAYVNSYATFVAPRIAGEVSRVLVEDNNPVKKGQVLLELDPEPYRVKLAVEEAGLDTARADLAVVKANTLGLLAQARSARFKLAHAMEEVDNQIAIIKQRVAVLKQSRVNLDLAKIEYGRVHKLVKTGAVSAELFDQKRAALEVARAQVSQALENVHQARVALGLPAEPANGANLDEVPADLDQNFSSVREALAELIHSAAQLGVVPSSLNLTPRQTLEEFYRRDPSGDIDRIYAEILRTAPALKQAQSQVEQAERAVDQAKLNLSYCAIKSEIDGVVTRRSVNPGDYVQIGQSLMAIRSLTNIWIDANFKETQLSDLRIGQHVSLKTDMYGSKKIFEGRISGFTMGTGSTLALLPAQNATGNFVKVVQRLPVRIDLVKYDPSKFPLFVGLSVEPEVDIAIPPTGPNAGKFLQAFLSPPVKQQP